MSSSPEAAATHALVALGVEVQELSAAGLVVQAAGRRAELSLGSLRRVLALAPAEEHPERIEGWARAAAASLRGEAPEGPVEDRLVPRLFAGKDPRLWTTALHPELHLAIAEDLPGRQRMLTPFDLPRLGLSMDRARAVALANLGAPEPQALQDLPGALRFAVGDGLDAARLLLLGRAPGALAVIPARDLCWWVPLDHPRAAELAAQLHAAARRLGDLPYPLSPHLWRLHPHGLERVA